MTVSHRPGPRTAAPELLVLQHAEEFCGWLLQRTARWPKRARFTLTQRLENHALDLVELLVVARYRPAGRRARLEEVNLRLERVRFLFRLVRQTGTCPGRTFEAAARQVDTLGRMLHGWRRKLSSGEGTQ